MWFFLSPFLVVRLCSVSLVLTIPTATRDCQELACFCWGSQNFDAIHRGTSPCTYRLKLPYLYDIDQFHNHLNLQNRDIQFTREVERKENFLSQYKSRYIQKQESSRWQKVCLKPGDLQTSTGKIQALLTAMAQNKKLTKVSLGGAMCPRFPVRMSRIRHVGSQITPAREQGT